MAESQTSGIPAKGERDDAVRLRQGLGERAGGQKLDLQVEGLVCAGWPMGNIRAEEASRAKNDRGGLLELLDLVGQVTIGGPGSFRRRR